MPLLLLLLFWLLCPTSFADELIIEPDAGRTPILSAIKQAQSSIKLAMYGLTDESFIASLITLKNQGKSVQVLLEPEPYQASGENTRAIQQLRLAQINLQWPDQSFQFIHQKTLLIDQQAAIVMTFNLTHSTFSHERNFALFITNPSEIQEIQHVFAADWAHQHITPHHPNLVWSPDNSREKMTTFLKSAHSNIKIYAEDISDYQLIGTLAKIARAGVKVNILLSTHFAHLHNKKLSYLHKAGVVLRNSKHYMIHAKVLLVDQQRALLGSINLTPASLDNNRELSVITQDPRVLNQLNATFEQDWREANRLKKPRPHSQWFTTKWLQTGKQL